MTVSPVPTNKGSSKNIRGRKKKKTEKKPTYSDHRLHLVSNVVFAWSETVPFC